MIYSIEKGKENSILRNVAKEITCFDEKLKQVYDNMVETIRKEGGCGLAGPQVGFPFRIFIILDPRTQRVSCYCNPVIKKQSDEICIVEEGCLSLPNLWGKVKRPCIVSIEARNIKGRKVRVKFDEVLSRIAQHEIDHLNGILFCDKGYDFIKE